MLFAKMNSGGSSVPRWTPGDPIEFKFTFTSQMAAGGQHWATVACDKFGNAKSGGGGVDGSTPITPTSPSITNTLVYDSATCPMISSGRFTLNVEGDVIQINLKIPVIYMNKFVMGSYYIAVQPSTSSPLLFNGTPIEWREAGSAGINNYIRFKIPSGFSIGTEFTITLVDYFLDDGFDRYMHMNDFEPPYGIIQTMPIVPQTIGTSSTGECLFFIVTIDMEAYPPGAYVKIGMGDWYGNTTIQGPYDPNEGVNMYNPPHQPIYMFMHVPGYIENSEVFQLGLAGSGGEGEGSEMESFKLKYGSDIVSFTLNTSSGTHIPDDVTKWDNIKSLLTIVADPETGEPTNGLPTTTVEFYDIVWT